MDAKAETRTPKVIGGVEVVDDTKTEAKAPSRKGGASPRKKTKAPKHPGAKKGGDTRRSGGKGTTKPKAAAPSPDITIAGLADAYLAHLKAIGKKETTVRSYAMDLKVAVRELGEKTKVKSLTPTKVGRYFESDAITKNRNGEPRSPITIAKVRRVFRLALTWLADTGAIEKTPLQEDMPKKTK